MTRTPLMPKATAVWLVDNTSLTFDQIARFCHLHVLEVKGIADGDVAHGIKGMDPIASGQLTREEIRTAQTDPSYTLKLSEPKVEIPEVKTKRGPRYTPVSRRQDRPNAILWLLRSHAELKDSQIMRLVGTTKPTIHSIRERTHWNSANLQPADPVTLGLCSQTDLDFAVQRAARRLDRERKQADKKAGKAGTLLPTEETIAEPSNQLVGAIASLVIIEKPKPAAKENVVEPRAENVFDTPAPKPPTEKVPDADSVFAKLEVLKEEPTAAEEKAEPKVEEEEEPTTAEEEAEPKAEEEEEPTAAEEEAEPKAEEEEEPTAAEEEAEPKAEEEEEPTAEEEEAEEEEKS